jgi:hypothetical protein
VAVALIGWFWPRKHQAEDRPPEEVKERLGEETVRQRLEALEEVGA